MGSLTCELCGSEQLRQLPKSFIDFSIDIVASFVLFLLHHIYYLFSKLSYWLRVLSWRCFAGSELISISKRSTKIAPSENGECLPVIKKVPVHCAFILGVEAPSYRDLSSIVEWSLASGISHISFYSHLEGVDPVALFDEISKHGRHIIPKIKWGKNFPSEVKKVSSKRINGFTWRPETTVHVYRKEDGVDSLGDVARELYSAGAKNITLPELRDVMSVRIKAPDPDLAVVCGEVLSLYAFLPWHCRITQIESLDSHHGLTRPQYLSLLYKYSHSEQRYGK